MRRRWVAVLTLGVVCAGIALIAVPAWASGGSFTWNGAGSHVTANLGWSHGNVVARADVPGSSFMSFRAMDSADAPATHGLQVPEPSGILALICGVMCIAGMVYRKRG